MIIIWSLKHDSHLTYLSYSCSKVANLASLNLLNLLGLIVWWDRLLHCKQEVCSLSPEVNNRIYVTKINLVDSIIEIWNLEFTMKLKALQLRPPFINFLIFSEESNIFVRRFKILIIFIKFKQCFSFQIYVIVCSTVIVKNVK